MTKKMLCWQRHPVAAVPLLRAPTAALPTSAATALRWLRLVWLCYVLFFPQALLVKYRNTAGVSD